MASLGTTLSYSPNALICVQIQNQPATTLLFRMNLYICPSVKYSAYMILHIPYMT